MNQLTPKTPREQIRYPFDFSPRLTVGDSVASVQWFIEAYEGTDANASTMLVGSPTLVGTIASEVIKGGVNGVTYFLEAIGTTANGEKISASGLLLVQKGA